MTGAVRARALEPKETVVTPRGLSLDKRHRTEAGKTHLTSFPSCLSISSWCLSGAECSHNPAARGAERPNQQKSAPLGTDQENKGGE